jgi:hypothetical protein
MKHIDKFNERLEDDNLNEIDKIDEYPCIVEVANNKEDFFDFEKKKVRVCIGKLGKKFVCIKLENRFSEDAKIHINSIKTRYRIWWYKWFGFIFF